MFYKFVYVSDTDGSRVTFTSFDLGNFLHHLDDKTTSGVEDWKIDVTKDISMLGSFEIVKQVPVILNNSTRPDKRKYPPFCFSGYEVYKVDILASKADKPTLKAILFATDILPDMEDMYYRKNILREQIIFNT